MDPKPDHGEKSYKGSGWLAGRKAYLVTGGDSGIGRAAVIAFAREGARRGHQLLSDRTTEGRRRSSPELIKAESVKALGFRATCATKYLCKKLVQDAVTQLGGLDILVCNARQQTRASILDVSSEDFDATMKTNVYAPFWIIKAALPHLPTGAVIIGTSSEQAIDPSPELYDYAQTKAATTNYVKSLAKQLASKGIRVNGVAPGPIWTPLQVSGGATMEKLKQFAALRRWVGPDSRLSLLRIYVQLAASDASYATGQIYGAEGGRAKPWRR